MKILAIENSQLFCKIYDFLAKHFKRRSFTVYCARNREEAVHRLECEPDLQMILLDINLPNINGLELLRYCKAQSFLQKIPVVIASTDDRKEEIAQGMRDGAVAWFNKRCTTKHFHRLMRRVLSRPKAAKRIRKTRRYTRRELTRMH